MEAGGQQKKIFRKCKKGLENMGFSISWSGKKEAAGETFEAAGETFLTQQGKPNFVSILSHVDWRRFQSNPSLETLDTPPKEVTLWLAVGIPRRWFPPSTFNRPLFHALCQPFPELMKSKRPSITCWAF